MTGGWDVETGLQGLANTVTSILGQAGELTNTVLDALTKVWEQATSALVPEGRTNWQAYTHKQLHEMLIDDADVGDVSTIADAWGHHSTELASHADALRSQQEDLRTNWHGQAADLAADRLGTLHDRVSSIASHAGEVQKAAQGAADALAQARRTMPPPPDDATNAMGFAPLPAVPAAPPQPGAAMTSAFGNVATGGASMYFGAGSMMGGKAQAVQVMQDYETGLLGSGRLIPDRQGDTDAASYRVDGLRNASTSAASFGGGGGVGGPGAGAGSGGVAWHDLVGGDRLGPRGTTGFGTGIANQAAMTEGAFAESAAAQRGTLGGFAPAGGARPGGGGDKDRTSVKLPTVDNQLFAGDETPSLPVIGL